MADSTAEEEKRELRTDYASSDDDDLYFDDDDDDDEDKISDSTNPKTAPNAPPTPDATKSEAVTVADDKAPLMPSTIAANDVVEPPPVETPTPAPAVTSPAASAPTPATGAAKSDKPSRPWLWFVAGFLLGGAVLGVLVAIILSADDDDDNNASSSNEIVAPQDVVSTSPSSPPTNLRQPIPSSRPSTTAPSIDEEQRFNFYFEDLMGDSIYEVGSPHQRAINWILSEDPRLLTSTSRASGSTRQADLSDPLSVPPEELQQRYLMAFFYFAFSDNGNSPWSSCSPSADTTTCQYTKYMSGGQLNSTSAERWLTAAWECEWAGVTCSDGTNVDAIGLYGQGLTGALATEIMLLPELKHLSLASSALDGRIPENYGKLVSLNLPANQLTGILPPAFFDQATSLREFNVSSNSLTGILPTQIANARKLETLDVSYNMLVSTLSVDVGSLEFLRVFHARNNQLVAQIPDALGRSNWATTLEELVLSNNKFSGSIPSTFGSFSRLQTLDLGGNDLIGTIPTQIYRLTNLKTLLLNSNNVGGPLSTEVGILESLERLDLNSNNLFGNLPVELAQLTRLQEVRLEFNDFTGSVPIGLCDLRPFLVVLTVDRAEVRCECCTSGDGIGNDRADNIYSVLESLLNDATSISDLNTPIGRAAEWIIYLDPAQLLSNEPNFVQRYMLAIFYFHLTNNGESLWTLCNPNFSDLNDESCVYQEINESGDSVTRTASRWLSGAPETSWNGINCDRPSANVVSQICLGRQNLVGTIPKQLALLSNLVSLYLPNNSISGPLPSLLSEFGTLNLESLNLNENRLIGTVPSQYFDQSNFLVELSLALNDLTGTIPLQFAGASIVFLDLRENSLIGTIPTTVGMLTMLQHLDFSLNFITGTIPTTVGLMSNLERLRLSRNSLAGTVPSELGMLSRLSGFEVRDCILEGTIPTEYGNLQELTLLDVEGNSFTGTIPTWFGVMTRLEHLLLGNNFFGGTIPTEMGLATSLKSLYLQTNQISGTIPETLLNWKIIEILHLNQNRLTGSIPSGTQQFPELREALFHSNSLTGSMPSAICVSLQSLWSDCGGPNPLVDCPCCTQCCIPNTRPPECPVN